MKGKKKKFTQIDRQKKKSINIYKQYKDTV